MTPMNSAVIDAAALAQPLAPVTRGDTARVIPAQTLQTSR